MQPTTHTAGLIGASGLIGGHLLTLLIADSRYNQIRILSRRPLPIQHPKVSVHVLDFTDEQGFSAALAGCDHLYCCVGTTRARVHGDMEAYRKVDFDIPVQAARLSAALGCRHYSLVTSVGADRRSRHFYLQLKGTVEDAVRQYAIPSVAIIRPSMLLGKRHESRPAERLGQLLMEPLAFLIPSKYKPIRAEVVASAMLYLAMQQAEGVRIYHYAELVDAATGGSSNSQPPSV